MILAILIIVILVALVLFVKYIMKEKYANRREKAFTHIYKNKLWGTAHPNGFGSIDIHTENDRNALSTIIKKYNIKIKCHRLL